MCGEDGQENFYVSNKKVCKKCLCEKSKEWQVNNPEKVKRARQLHYLKYRDKILEYQGDYRAKNRWNNLFGGLFIANRQFKKCTICKQELTLDCFTRNKARWDGLEAFCRGCNVGKQRKWRQNNRLRSNQMVYESMARNKDKQVARAKANGFFKVKEPCSFDGCQEIGEKHHPNYSNPLDVLWYCRKHHHEIERQLSASML